MRNINSTPRNRRSVFYGWWLLAGSVIAMALASGVSFWSFGLYIDPLETEFGWSRAEVSLGFSISLLVSGLAAALVSAAAGGGILSRLAFGVLADRIRRIETAAMGLLAFLMAGMATLLLDSGTAGIAIFLAFWIVGSGGGPLLEPLLLPRAFGMAHFGAILGTFGVIETVGLIVSPAVAGAIFDSTGSYDWVLVMLLAAFGTALALFYVAARLPLPLAAHLEPDANARPTQPAPTR